MSKPGAESPQSGDFAHEFENGAEERTRTSTLLRAPAPQTLRFGLIDRISRDVLIELWRHARSSLKKFRMYSLARPESIEQYDVRNGLVTIDDERAIVVYPAGAEVDSEWRREPDGQS